MSKQQQPDQKNRVQKTAVSKRAKKEINRSAAGQQSGLNNSIDNAGQLSTADMQDMQQTYGNHFLQRLVGVSLDSSEEEEETAMRSADGEGGLSVSDGFESRIDQARGGGQSLPGDFRQQMEGQFGADFSSVRVHTDSESDALNQSIQAKAFTTGSDIFFKKGEYNTSNKDGQKLVAHELTHVVQQGGSKQGAVQPQMTVNPPDDKYEQEADSAAEQAVEGAEANTSPTASPPATGGETAVANEQAPPEKEASGSVSDEGAIDELMSLKDHPDVKYATEEANKASKPSEGAEGETSKEASEKDAVTAAKEENEESVTAPEEGKKEKKKEENDEEKKEEKDEKGVPKLKKEDTGPLEDMKYDEEKIEEPEPPKRVPSWDELAYGTVQTFAIDEVMTESLLRNQLIMGPEFVGATEAQPDAPAPAEPESKEESSSESKEEPEVDKFDLIKDAFVGGASSGFLEGATEFATDQATENFLARGPGKKIPYADGMLGAAQIAMDPQGWAGGVKDAFGQKGFDKMESGWDAIGKEATWAGKIAGFLEATIGTIDWITTMLGHVQTILQIVLMILTGIATALTATGVGASVVPVLLKIISFLEKINNIISNVTNFLNAVKAQLQVLAIIFRTIDIAIFEGDPEELADKRDKLKANVQGVVKYHTQRTLNNKFGDGRNDRKDQKKLDDAKTNRRDQIDTMAGDVPDPKTGKSKQDMIDDYEKDFGSSYDVDSRQSRGDDSADPVDKARDGKLNADAQVKKAENDLQNAKDSIDKVEAQERFNAAKAQQENANENLFNMQTGKMMDEGGLLGTDSAPAPKEKTKWEKFKDKAGEFDQKVLFGQGGAVKSEVGSFKDRKTDRAGWAGQRHGGGVTGQSNGLYGMLLSELTDGQYENVTAVSSAMIGNVFGQNNGGSGDGESADTSAAPDGPNVEISYNFINYDLQIYQQNRTLDIIEQLPEPPDSARQITASAETYNMLAAQQDIAKMRQEDIAMRQEDAQSQIIEMEKTQEISATNQAELVGVQQEAAEKLQAQDQEKAASKDAATQASQAQSEASAGQGLMGMIMAPLTKMLTTVVKEFTDQDTSSGTGSAHKANSAMKEPTKGADTAVAGGDAGVAEAQERTQKTLRAQSDVAQVQKDFKVMDQTMQEQTLNAEEGITELEEAQDQNQEEVGEMEEGKEEALNQYEDGIAEAEEWAEEHRSMREMLFDQLNEELAEKAEGER
ncbi:MAG: DUF4157 domain-containing protein [Chloroflexota bacterium]